MEILFFKKLKKLMNNYLITKNNKYKDQILLIFLNLNYKTSSLHLINYSITNDFDLFDEFVSFLAFTNLINFKTLKPLTNNELYLLDGLIMLDNQLIYDDFERFEWYKKIQENNI